MSNLKQKIEEKSATVAVIGLGYVGLPLAAELARAGFLVYGIDTSEDKISSLKSGISYISDIPSESIKEVACKTLIPVNDFSAILNADIVIICVPTPLNSAKQPDVSHIKAAVDGMIDYLKKGTLIVLESTSYPGTTEELILAEVERKRGFIAGRDCYICYSPERMDPGNKAFSVSNTPKVIGGITKECIGHGRLLYEKFTGGVITVSTTRTAEMVKLLENTFRSVNIGMVNELTRMCERLGINIWEVIEAAASKPFGFMPFYPGPGTGGHCIPLDPLYLSWRGKTFNFYNRFIELADDINSNMPVFAVHQITEILNGEGKPVNDAKILLLGITYKKDVEDLRESPSLAVYRLLREKGAALKFHDPYAPFFLYGNELIHSTELTGRELKEADLTVITTDHSNVDYQFVTDNARIVFDTRNATKNCSGGNVILLGGCAKNAD